LARGFSTQDILGLPENRCQSPDDGAAQPGILPENGCQIGLGPVEFAVGPVEKNKDLRKGMGGT
jgi:hypothetical protein